MYGHVQLTVTHHSVASLHHLLQVQAKQRDGKNAQYSWHTITRETAAGQLGESPGVVVLAGVEGVPWKDSFQGVLVGVAGLGVGVGPAGGVGRGCLSSPQLAAHCSQSEPA